MEHFEAFPCLVIYLPISLSFSFCYLFNNPFAVIKDHDTDDGGRGEHETILKEKRKKSNEIYSVKFGVSVTPFHCFVHSP